MKLKDLRIGTRLGIGFGILVALMAVLVIISLSATNAMHKDLKKITGLNTAKIQAANELKDGIKTVNLAIFTTLVSKDKDILAQSANLTRDGRAIYLAAADKIDKLETTEKGRQIINAIKQSNASGKEGNAKAMEAAKAGKSDEALSIYLGTVLPAALNVFGLCDELIKYQQDDMSATTARMESSYLSTFVFLLVLGCIGLAAAVVMTLVLRRNIVRGVQKGIAATEMLAAGKLNFEIAAESNDEIGTQALALKGMVEKWRGIIGSIKEASDNVASTSTQMSAGAEQMARGADEQAKRSHQVATASQELSQTVLDISQNAANIAATAQAASSTAKDGGRIVEESVEGSREIAQTVQESVDHITSLADLSHRIGEIIGIINEIADQTNLLALNAAIEAARAGEHGRGFAVVADEVRKLAERTTGATSEVSGIIKEIQHKVGGAVSSIQDVSTKVDRGVELSTKAGAELRNIVAGVDDLQAMVQQIATAIEEMSATSDQISQDIESISNISNDTSQSSAEVSKASRELSTLGVDLQRIAQQFEV